MHKAVDEHQARASRHPEQQGHAPRCSTWSGWTPTAVHVPLNQVAMVAAPEPRMLTVQPFDKGLTQAIEKAIRDARPRAQSGHRRAT